MARVRSDASRKAGGKATRKSGKSTPAATRTIKKANSSKTGGSRSHNRAEKVGLPSWQKTINNFFIVTENKENEPNGSKPSSEADADKKDSKIITEILAGICLSCSQEEKKPVLSSLKSIAANEEQIGEEKPGCSTNLVEEITDNSQSTTTTTSSDSQQFEEDSPPDNANPMPGSSGVSKDDYVSKDVTDDDGTPETKEEGPTTTSSSSSSQVESTPDSDIAKRSPSSYNAVLKRKTAPRMNMPEPKIKKRESMEQKKKDSPPKPSGGRRRAVIVESDDDDE